MAPRGRRRCGVLLVVGRRSRSNFSPLGGQDGVSKATGQSVATRFYLFPGASSKADFSTAFFRGRLGCRAVS